MFESDNTAIDVSQFTPITNFIVHPTVYHFVHSEAKTRCTFKGGQGGGTASHMYDLTLRLLGIHPVEWRNDIKFPIRLISKVQPKGNEDVLNQQYVELKKLLPYENIKRDITTHPPAIMTVKNPYGGSQDYVVELMSSQQEIDAFMSVQRQALYIDEELEKLKYDENQIRLMVPKGDTNIALTPVKGLDWTFDNLWRRASKIYRSETINKKYGFPMVEELNNNTDIECFCWATDDNPVLDKDTIKRIFENIVDPDDLAMRRYGIFKQATGQIYKMFDVNTHKISVEKYWNEILFKTYWHYRVIDYHPTKPWYVSWVGISPHNEWFVWNEWVASHDRVTTEELRDTIKRKSLIDENGELNRKTLIDPLAKEKQPNTGYSMFEDISTGENALRRVQAADTKNQQGRMNVKMRLQNSLKCEVPYNNKRTDGEKDPRFNDYIPTMWFFENCLQHIEHFRNWRSIDYRTELAKATHDDRRLTQKWSDFCRNMEFLGNLNPVFYNSTTSSYEPPRQFTGRA